VSEQAPDYVSLRDELRVGAHVCHKTRGLAGIVFSLHNGAAMVAMLWAEPGDDAAGRFL